MRDVRDVRVVFLLAHTYTRTRARKDLGNASQKKVIPLKPVLAKGLSGICGKRIVAAALEGEDVARLVAVVVGAEEDELEQDAGICVILLDGHLHLPGR